MTPSPATHKNASGVNSIKLILETDAIIQPVTGIGRYAFELLKSFHSSPDIEALRCIDRGLWKRPGSILETFERENTQPTIPSPPERWHKNPVKAALRKLLPLVQGLQLAGYASEYIYHSPNYRLMPYKGKSVVTFHDLSLIRHPELHPEDRLDELVPALEKSAMQADHIITDSEKVRREVMSHYGLGEDRVTAVPLASSFEPRSTDVPARDRYLEDLGLAPGRYLLFTSTLEPRKNVGGLLRAYRELPASTRAHFPLVLAGQLGWKSDDISAELSNPETARQVRHIGYVSNQQLSYLYSGARTFVYPTYYEGFGLPPIEAQAFSVPVITSNRSCLPEVTGGAALLIDPDDCDELTRAMLRLIEDPGLHTKLAQQGLENVRRFSWQNTAAQTIDVYRRVMQH